MHFQVFHEANFNEKISRNTFIPVLISLWLPELLAHCSTEELSNRHGPKWAEGRCCAPFRGGAGPHLTQCRLGQGLPLYKWYLIHPAVWPQQTWATVYMDADIWLKDCCAPFSAAGGARSPSNTMWPGPRPTSTPSGVLIYPTVWPQYTNVTDRQTGHTMVQ